MENREDGWSEAVIEGYTPEEGLAFFKNEPLFPEKERGRKPTPAFSISVLFAGLVLGSTSGLTGVLLSRRREEMSSRSSTIWWLSPWWSSSES